MAAWQLFRMLRIMFYEKRSMHRVYKKELLDALSVNINDITVI